MEIGVKKVSWRTIEKSNPSWIPRCCKLSWMINFMFLVVMAVLIAFFSEMTQP